MAQQIGPTRDGPLQAAVISGLFGVALPPPFKCPGSNCTYPPFTSLGISNDCVDVTAETTQSCIQTNQSIPNQICNYTLPSGALLGSFAAVDAHNGFMHTTINATVSPYDSSSGYNTLTTGFALAGVAIIMFADDDLQDNFHISTEWQKTLVAYECTYQLRAYAYVAWTQVNGALQSGQLLSSLLNRKGDGPIIPFEAADASFPGNRTFYINYFDAAFIGMALSILDPSLSGQANFYLDALYNSANLTRTMAGIATAMSYRMLSGPNATAVEGEVSALQTYIGVHWAWLALVVSLEPLAFAFLVSVMIETGRMNRVAWKSSLAPLLYRDVLTTGAHGGH